MIARIAYLTSPAPDRYVLQFQSSHGVNFEVEISEGHLANIIADGAHYAFRKQCPTALNETNTTEDAEHERAAAGT